MTLPVTAKYGRPVSTGSVYTWTFPGSPIRIKFPLDLIARLRAEIEVRPGGEAGGVLLGRPKNQTTLEIDNYLWVSSEAHTGGHYHLDEAELESLREVYTFVVGYFRTEPADYLQLRDEEAAYIAKNFPDTTNVVLLIQTSRQPYNAGFFFWMKEGLLAPVSFMDFPLDADLLDETKPEPRVTQPAAEVERTLPLLETAGRAAAPVNPPSVSSPAARPERAENETISVPLMTPDLDQLAVRISTVVPGNKRKQNEARARTPKSEATTKMMQQRMLIATGIVCGLLPLAGMFAFLVRDWLSAPPPKPRVAAPASPFQLAVESQGNGLNIRWNPQSPTLAQAREGHLVISEGDKRPRTIILTPQLLMTGHIYYRSAAERLQFELEVVDTSGKVSKESVLTLSSKP